MMQDETPFQPGDGGKAEPGCQGVALSLIRLDGEILLLVFNFPAFTG